jgi:hypothetical protein
MTKTFDIFGHINNLLEILVLSIVEDWVVHDDAVDFRVCICGYQCIFNIVLVHGFQCVCNATTTVTVSWTNLLRFGWLDRCQRCLFLTFPCRSSRSSRRIISQQDQRWLGRLRGGEGGSTVEVHTALRRGGLWQCCWRGVLCMMLAHHP